MRIHSQASDPITKARRREFDCLTFLLDFEAIYYHPNRMPALGWHHRSQKIQPHAFACHAGELSHPATPLLFWGYHPMNLWTFDDESLN